MKMDKAKVENCIAKTRAFYDTKAVGCALLKVKNIATLPSPALSLTDYTFPDDVYKYLDARAQCTIERLAQRAELADDTVPAEGPWYGIAEHTAFLGGRVDYESDTSWHYAMLDAPGELEKLANTLRGNDFFYDFYEEPEDLKALLDYCADALVWNYEKQMEAAGDVYGGVVTGFGEWLPGRGLGHVSEDTTTMISLEQFEEFGRPRTERIFRKFDEVFIHMHALSERCLASVASLPNIRLMELSSDPNTDRAVEVWKRSREKLTRVIPVLRLTRAEIESNMDLLKSQKTVVWYDAACMEDAQDMCALFARELPVR